MEGKTALKKENKPYYVQDNLKRIFDFVFSVLGFTVLSPVFLLICLWIKLDSRGPVIFKQERIGRYEAPFKILKFRTMVTDAEKLGKQITIGEDKRITRVGNFLRKYKLDELPQLINVIKGDMSLVGPRPEVPRYTKHYTDEQRMVFDVRPGITDYASIKYSQESELLGKSTDPEKTYIEEIMKDKLDLNLEYIKKRSIKEDFSIILKTIKKIIE